jgi:hypothetical protein
MLTIWLMVISATSFAGVWEDRFEDGNADGWNEVEGDWEIKDGVYEQTIMDAAYQKSMLELEDLTDFTMEVDITILEGGAGSTSVAAGVLLRGTDDGSSGYRFWIRDDTNGFQFSLWQDNAYTNVVGVAAERATAGETYRLKVQLEGFEFSAWVDDRLVLDEHVEQGKLFTSGQVGFINYNCHVQYDNLTIDGPNVISNLSVAPAGKLVVAWGTIKMSKAN